MSQAQSSEEVKIEMVKSMGDEFGSLFFELRNETLILTLKWNKYKELYGTKESRIDILNESAPTFFYMIERVMRENILLGISRLTDPPEMRGKKNITINAVPNFLDDDHLKDQITTKLHALKESTKFCKDWRNRHIAHNDYSLKLDTHAKPLEESTRIKIEQVLSEIQDIIDVLYRKFLGGPCMFDALRSSGGAISVLHTLEDGLTLENKRKDERIPLDNEHEQSRIY